MNVGVVGLGHVGLITALSLAHVGHKVVGVDRDAERIDNLRHGKTPFVEPALEDELRALLDDESVRFSHSLRDSVARSEVVFICVGTPTGNNGEADLSGFEQLAEDIAPLIEGYTVLVEKSTVPTGTGQRLARTIARFTSSELFDVVSNPEFLREGNGLRDALSPSRIVIGSASDRAKDRMLQLYRPLVELSGSPMLVTSIENAELIKHASNAFLATKISFINAVAEVCEASGADVEIVARGMGLDARIGSSFLGAGVGYGGSCFPKDISAFNALAEGLGVRFGLLDEARRVNEDAPARLIARLRGELWHLTNKTIALLGVSFKPDTDDIREAPALRIAELLLDEGAEVVAYDPVAMHAAKAALPSVRFAPSALDALRGAHAAVIATEWEEFRKLGPSDFKSSLRFPVVADGRNLFSAQEMGAAGVTYISVGRPVVRQ